jgi:hypothetical protein
MKCQLHLPRIGRSPVAENSAIRHAEADVSSLLKARPEPDAMPDSRDQLVAGVRRSLVTKWGRILPRPRRSLPPRQPRGLCSGATLQTH